MLQSISFYLSLSLTQSLIRLFNVYILDMLRVCVCVRWH